MAQPKFFNTTTGQWEPLTVGVTGPTGPQGPPGVDGVDGTSGVAIQPEEPADTSVLWVDEDDSYSEVGDFGNVPIDQVVGTEFKLWNPTYGVTNTGFAVGRVFAWPTIIHPSSSPIQDFGIRVMTATASADDIMEVALYRPDGTHGLYVPTACTKELSTVLTGLNTTGSKQTSFTDWPAHQKSVWRWLVIRVPSTNSGTVTIRANSSAPLWSDLSYSDGRQGIGIAAPSLIDAPLPDVMPSWPLSSSPATTYWGPSSTPQPRLYR